MLPLKLLLSVHDVTPCHASRLMKVEPFLTALGVDRVTYLLVPNFHGRWDVREHQSFVDWCRKSRPFAVQWFLHGLFHSETAAPIDRWTCSAKALAERRVHPRAPGIKARVKATLLTAGEGEFLTLGAADIEDRIRRGTETFARCLNISPSGFVAPAWLLNRDLLPVLKNFGFEFTEDYGGVYQVQTGRRASCPVVTWATRTWLRRHGSRMVCPALIHYFRHRPLLRLALHPTDFDYPRTVDSIGSVLRTALRDRELAHYDNALFEVSCLHPQL